MIYTVKSVKLPSTVKRIDDRAFFYCKTLLSVEIPTGSVSIGNDAFGDCPAIITYSDGTLWNDETEDERQDAPYDYVFLKDYGMLPGENVYTVGSGKKDLVLRGSIKDGVTVRIDPSVENIREISLGALRVSFDKTSDYVNHAWKTDYRYPIFYQWRFD